MMAIGMSRAVPSGDNSTRPSARGPFGFDLRVLCADTAKLTPIATSAQMTPQPALRYNHGRIGDSAMLDVNDKAPDITLEDENGKEVSLKDFKGKTVILYFYPRADTPGCTKEACSFRDD